MGNYTRQTENYPTSRRERNQNPQQNQPVQAGFIYTCWKCNKSFELKERGKTDEVRCPYCNMVHGLITSK